MLLEDYLRCSGGLAKQATGRKLVVCALCTHRPGGASPITTSLAAVEPVAKNPATEKVPRETEIFDKSEPIVGSPVVAVEPVVESSATVKSAIGSPVATALLSSPVAAALLLPQKHRSKTHPGRASVDHKGGSYGRFART
jgi:hypothetical protein